jgi:hypothetical protein
MSAPSIQESQKIPVSRITESPAKPDIEPAIRDRRTQRLIFIFRQLSHIGNFSFTSHSIGKGHPCRPQRFNSKEAKKSRLSPQRPRFAQRARGGSRKYSRSLVTPHFPSDAISFHRRLTSIMLWGSQSYLQKLLTAAASVS